MIRPDLSQLVRGLEPVADQPRDGADQACRYSGIHRTSSEFRSTLAAIPKNDRQSARRAAASG